MTFQPSHASEEAYSVFRCEKGGRELDSPLILYIMRHIWNLDEEKVRELFTISEGLSAKGRKFLVDRVADYIR